MAPKLLIVDDSDLYLQRYGRLLTRVGFDVLTESNPAQVHTRTLETRPDLVILEMNPAGTDGLELLEALKSDPNCSGIPVILYSTTMQHDRIQTGIEKGAFDFVHKGKVNVKDFGLKIRAALKK